MPTPDQRLDQLEPIISELLARQDETAAKVERVSAQVRQLTVTTTNALTKQSDSIEFLLNKTVQLEQGQVELRQEVDGLRQEVGGLRQEIGELRQEVGQQFSQLFLYLKDRLQ